MPKKEAPLHTLQQFLPKGTLEPVLEYIRFYKIHLTVAKERKSILGDYRHNTHHKNHRISVNGNLNPFAFLITFLHEAAHLLTFEKFGNRVEAHGKEWKHIYSKILEQFVQKKIFPADIENALLDSIKNPAASSCAEDGLMRVLRKYNPENHLKLIEELTLHQQFKLEDGRVFIRLEKQRKRYKCKDAATGKLYLFSPVFEVEEVC